MRGGLLYYLGVGALVSTGMLAGALVEGEIHPVERTLRWMDPSAQAKRLDEASNISDRHNRAAREVPCPPRTGTMVALIVGQSNTANFAAQRTRAGPGASVFYRGRCYEAADPLLGASGARGSPWPGFADRILASGQYRRVLLVPVSIGATSMASWAPGGIHHDRITARLAELSAQRLSVTHVLIGQGEYEAESGSDPVAYRTAAVELIRALPPSRVFLATTGKCEGPENEAIRSAQADARAATEAFAGPDMDMIGDRINGCHLGARAQAEVAAAWTTAVLRSGHARSAVDRHTQGAAVLAGEHPSRRRAPDSL